MINIASLKENPEYRKKIIIATAVFIVMVISIIIFIIGSSSENNPAKDTSKKENNIEGHHIAGDSIAIENTDKNFSYNFGEQSESNSDDIINDGISGGKTQEDIPPTYDDDLSNYMKQRQHSINRMQMQENNVNTRRSYNPNGNSSDWTSINTEKRVNSNPFTSQNNDINEYEKTVESRKTFSSLTEKTSLPQQNLKDPQQVKAKLISQGYAQTGRNLTFMLLEPAEIAGKKTKKGQLITGTAQEQNNRLLINFAGIKIDDRIYPVNIELLGSDGGKGLPIAGGEDTYNNVEGEIRNQAGGLVSRIPVVGEVISSVTRSSGNNNRNQSIKLNSNIKCYLMIY